MAKNFLIAQIRNAKVKGLRVLADVYNDLEARKTEINDTTESAGSVYSSEKIESELAGKLENKADVEAVLTGEISSHSHAVAEYLVPVWAEENAGLAANGHEWAYGNGANSALDDGIVIYVPSGWTCQVVAMSLKLGATPTAISVQLNLNGVSQGATCNVTCTAVRAAVNDDFSPLAIVSGDYINFRTQTVSGSTAGPNVVCAWLKYTKT